MNILLKLNKPLVAKSSSILFLCISLFASCNSDKGKTTAGKDTSDEAGEHLADSLKQSVTRYVLTSEGIGPVTPGMKTRTWPQLAEGLYDSIEEGIGGEGDQYEFYLEGQPMVTVMDFGQGEADLVVVSDPSLKAKVGNAELGLGDSFAKLLAQPGVRAEWEQFDEEGMWYWTTGGLWFAPSQDNLPDDLAGKLYDSRKPPVSSDFPPEVGIGYIGTGLPF